MRASLARLATIARTGGNYLQSGTPTGLTGLSTHPTPRPHLIAVYSHTLDKLRQVPESSVYRQSVEAITKARLAVVESTIPEGFEAWQQRVQKQAEQHPHIFGPGGSAERIRVGDKEYIKAKRPVVVDERVEEWDGEVVTERTEGAADMESKKNQHLELGEGLPREELQGRTRVELEDEPPLTTNQVQDIEARIGGGLIEEVVEVAERELELVDEMVKARVWEELEEKPAENQWQYFERATHVGATQGP